MGIPYLPLGNIPWVPEALFARFPAAFKLILPHTHIKKPLVTRVEKFHLALNFHMAIFEIPLAFFISRSRDDL